MELFRLNKNNTVTGSNTFSGANTFSGTMALTNAVIAIGAVLKTGYNKLMGYTKFDYRPTGGGTNSYAVQIRHNVGNTSGLVSSLDHEAHIVATGTASLRGVQGVAVVDDTKTVTGGTLNGVYGQVRNDGAVAGAGFLAALYGILEAGNAITASHVCSAWLDSHQANAVTGNHELLYMTNNGAAVLDQMIFTYGDANALINLDADVAATPAFITGPGTAANGTPLKIKIIYKGTPYYINAYPTDNV